MKKLTLHRLWTSLLAVLAISPALAQPVKQVIPASLKPEQSIASTTTPVMSITAKEKSAVSAAAVNAKVLRAFDESFKGSENPFWTTANNRSAAEFRMGDRQALVLYNNDGRRLHTILYGTGKHLSPTERQLVLYDYPGYEITASQEISAINTKLWVVMIQDDRQIIRLGVKDGELHELERFKRSK